MTTIRALPLPPGSLLALHGAPGDHADCYAADVPRTVGLGAYVEAFYLSRGFLPERLFLALLGRGANAAEVRALARGETARVAAWRVEARGERELLMIDFAARTRSWLMAEPLETGGTRLHFGSGILRRDGQGLGDRAERGLFRALLPVHGAYSKVLLRAAAKRLARR